MRVLLLGATGDPSSRAIPASLAHGHTVTVFVRSYAKLRSLLTPAFYDSQLSTLSAQQQVIVNRLANPTKLGKERRKPLKACFTGGAGSLEYPGTGGYQVQDYLPAWVSAPHRETENVMRSLDVKEIEWTLLCVALMEPRSDVIDVLDEPVPHGLAIGATKAPAWRDSWFLWVPFVGDAGG